MKSLPRNQQWAELSRRIIWFESPEQALADPIRFPAYAMTYAMFNDMQTIRTHVTDDELREALQAAPPGIIDPRSWSYWHLKLGQFPAPEMPQRSFEGLP